MGGAAAAVERRRPQSEDHFIVRIDHFIKATRDSGYKSTGSAISELVDNALQAGARAVDIVISETDDPTLPLRVTVADDGHGMDAATLRQALRFGGTTRFADRTGLGRYGMGLPNSSLSQARRVEVFSRGRGGPIVHSYLDVDEIAGGQLAAVPKPDRAEPGEGLPALKRSGTLIVWSKCDRLDNRRISTLSKKLRAFLGRVFRHYLWAGVRITVNELPVEPVDPLFLNPQAVLNGASQFGDTLTLEVENQEPSASGARVGIVKVTFSELPIHDWHGLPNDEKRRRGVSKGAGVSVVRAGREIDYGWLFMGTKRKENYDDWWRCEVQFDPVLDEAFGITHTKQGIRPRDYLLEILTPALESTARALNTRARRAHFAIKSRQQASAAEQVAAKLEPKLIPLNRPAASIEQSLEQLAREVPALKAVVADASSADGVSYAIQTQRRRATTAIYDFVYADGKFVMLLNEEHPFYKRVFAPLAQSDQEHDRVLCQQLQLTLLAAARAEATCTTAAERSAMSRFRDAWSKGLGMFLNAKLK